MTADRHAAGRTQVDGGADGIGRNHAGEAFGRTPRIPFCGSFSPAFGPVLVCGKFADTKEILPSYSSEIIGFLTHELPLHHADEELDLFPAIRAAGQARRCDRTCA